jgi:uncharacterized membrane protein YphA (DoxX/SURF4 family)
MKPYPKYLDWLRYLSAYLLFTYGISKLAGVQFALSPDIARRAIGSLSGFQLTWYYYSYSHIYASLLGLTQLVGGALLLFRKTALMGAAIMTPVMANILMINLFFPSPSARRARRRSSSFLCSRCCGGSARRYWACSGVSNSRRRLPLRGSTAQWRRWSY